MKNHYLRCYAPQNQGKADQPRFLVTLDVGIGDAVAIGLRAVEQIIENDPLAVGTIDVLCNDLQAQIFAYDPRINRIIETNEVFFPGTHMDQWLRGMILDSGAGRVVHFLRQRHYEAVLPSVVAPGLYLRLQSHTMYPRLFELAKNFLFLHKRAHIHESTIVKHMVDHYFNKPAETVPQDKDILLFIPSVYVQNARQAITKLKQEAFLEEKDGKVLVIAPDTASAVTRPPLDLLIAALSGVLAAQANLLIAILPSYTETTRSLHLLTALGARYPHRTFLIPAEPKAHLLETTAFIDQADIFVTGDTGVMHLAAAHKVAVDEHDPYLAPRNGVKIIALFGGTNPGYYGYRKRTTIVGWGRKEQTALRPGFFKESYTLREPHLFDHISSQQIINAILA